MGHSTPSLQAGIARRVISPIAGTPLFGYPVDRFGFEIADNLNATVLVLKNGSSVACLISLDLCLIEEDEVTAIRRDIERATPIPFDNITVCASHTHSAPITVTAWGWGNNNQEYLDSIRPNIVEAAVEASNSIQPVRVGIGTGQTEIGINRREVQLDGSVGLGFNEWGPRDNQLTVLRFETPNGVLSSLVHLSAHPTCRGIEPSVSRDWPGVMMDRVEHVTKAPVLFINGAFGDVAPRTSVGGSVGDGAPAANEVGLRAATDVLQVWRDIKEFRALDLCTFTEAIELPYSPLPSTQEAQKQLAALGNVGEHGAERAQWEHWNAVLKAHQTEPQKSRAWQQTITQLGPVAILPFAGEIFSEIALRLKQASPFAYTLCAGTSNGSHGYYVTREARARGGYEPEVAKAYGAYIFAENIDDVLVRENLRLLYQMAQPNTYQKE